MDIKEHKKTFEGFMTFAKVGTIFVILVLIGMAFFLV